MLIFIRKINFTECTTVTVTMCSSPHIRWVSVSSELVSAVYMSAHTTRARLERNSSRMASKDTTQSSPHPTRTKSSCVGLLRLLFIAFIHVAQANKQGNLLKRAVCFSPVFMGCMYTAASLQANDC